jgi:hypothetical protein
MHIPPQVAPHISQDVVYIVLSNELMFEAVLAFPRQRISKALIVFGINHNNEHAHAERDTTGIKVREHEKGSKQNKSKEI